MNKLSSKLRGNRYSSGDPNYVPPSGTHVGRADVDRDEDYVPEQRHNTGHFQEHIDDRFVMDPADKARGSNVMDTTGAAGDPVTSATITNHPKRQDREDSDLYAGDTTGAGNRGSGLFSNEIPRNPRHDQGYGNTSYGHNTSDIRTNNPSTTGRVSDHGTYNTVIGAGSSEDPNLAYQYDNPTTTTTTTTNTATSVGTALPYRSQEPTRQNTVSSRNYEPSTHDTVSSRAYEPPIPDNTPGRAYDPAVRSNTPGRTHDPAVRSTTPGGTYNPAVRTNTPGGTYVPPVPSNVPGRAYEPTARERTPNRPYDTTVRDNTEYDTTIDDTHLGRPQGNRLSNRLSGAALGAPGVATTTDEAGNRYEQSSIARKPTTASNYNPQTRAQQNYDIRDPYVATTGPLYSQQTQKPMVNNAAGVAGPGPSAAVAAVHQYGPYQGAKVLHRCTHCGEDDDISRYFRQDAFYRIG